MHRIRFLTAASIAALFSVTACSSEPEMVSPNGEDPQAKDLATAAPVELPPAIQVTRTYRCKDNRLFYADFYTNNTAHVRTEQTGTPTTLTAPAAGEAYVADGYSLSGSGAEVSYTAPGKGTQSCKA